MRKSEISEEINAVRDLYLQAAYQREKTDLFLEYLEKISVKMSPLLEAYHGAALTMQADRLVGNVNKFNSFSSGKEKIELAVKLDKENIEIRFLRFMIQTKIPKFINYNTILEDKSLLIKNISKINLIENLKFVNAVYDSLLNSTEFTETEKAILRIYRNMPTI